MIFMDIFISSCLIIRPFLIVTLDKNKGKIETLSSDLNWPFKEYPTPQINLENNFK